MENVTKVEVECLGCGHRDQLAWRTTGGMVVRRCPKCRETDLLFVEGIYGVVTNRAENIKRIKVALSEKDTQSWAHLQAVMDRIRAKMGSGKVTERMCVFCDDAPHTDRYPCGCFCHPIREFMQKVKEPGHGELERRVA